MGRWNAAFHSVEVHASSLPHTHYLKPSTPCTPMSMPLRVPATPVHLYNTSVADAEQGDISGADQVNTCADVIQTWTLQTATCCSDTSSQR